MNKQTLKQSNILFYLLIFSLLWPLYGCDNNKIDTVQQKENLINKTIQKRLSRYKNDKIKKCKDKALLKADNFVTEKLLNEFSSLMKDTLLYPQKPVRPPMPENLELDTIGVYKIEDFKLKKEVDTIQ